MTKMGTKKILKSSLGSLLLVVLMSCNNTADMVLVRNYGPAQGSTYSISYIAKPGVDYRHQIDSILFELDKSMSLWDKYSTISRLNAGDTVELDYHFSEVFKKSQYISEETSGSFDISVAPLVNYWGFGPDGQGNPDSTRVDSIMQLVGYEKIKFLLDSNFLPPKMKIDMNALAQGYTVDVISDFLLGKGIQNYLVEVGGELRASGKNLEGKIWRVGIDKPKENVDPENRFQVIVALDGMALATSGNYRKFWVDEKTGVKYVHTINPKTGFPIRTRLLSATIIANNAMEADAWATACMVVGLKKAQDFLLARPELKGYFVYSDLDGKWKVWHTPNFEEIIR